MKKLLLGCLSLLLFLNINCHCQDLNNNNNNQSSNPLYDEAVDKSDYVFEGVIIKETFYRRPNFHRIICSDIIRINKVFRGNIKSGTVEVLCYVGIGIPNDVSKIEFNPQDLKNSSIDTFGIFYCRLGKEFPFDPLYNSDNLDNKILLTDYHTNNIILHGDRTMLNLNGFFNGTLIIEDNIRSKEIVYNRLRKYSNLNVPEHAEPEPMVIRQDPRYGPNTKFKTKKQFDAFMDSVSLARGCLECIKRYHMNDSIENVKPK